MINKLHKHNCQCDRCIKADELLKPNKKRYIPQSVLREYEEKLMKQSELDLFNGLIVIQCPSCKHYVKLKINPLMKCSSCCYIIK